MRAKVWRFILDDQHRIIAVFSEEKTRHQVQMALDAQYPQQSQISRCDRIEPVTPHPD